MKKEVGNFVTAVNVFINAIADHEYSNWAIGAANVYLNHLDSAPRSHPFLRNCNISFKTKELIDVYINTKFVHMPEEKRIRQFNRHLEQVQGNKEVLTWLFLTEIHHLSMQILVVGRVISWWFNKYCDHHKLSPDVLPSLCDQHAGLGKAEKEKDRHERLLNEKAGQLANHLWLDAGKPEGGPSIYFDTARAQLVSMLQP